MISHNLVTFCLFCSIFFAVMFEAYSYYFRSFSHSNVVYSTVLSSWILYLSRICNVVTMILLAYSIESKINTTYNMLIFFIVHFFSFFYIYLILFKLKSDPFFKILITVINFLFKANVNYGSNNIKSEKLSYKIFLSSFSVSFLIFLSVVFPLLSAYHFFDFRMTLTYTSSIFNFLASGILLSYIEPSFALKSNTQFYSKTFYSIFLGKVLAQFIIALTSLLLFFLINR